MNQRTLAMMTGFERYTKCDLKAPILIDAATPSPAAKDNALPTHFGLGYQLSRARFGAFV